MVTELARGIRPSLIQGCFHSSTGNLISFYPTTNRHFVLQAGDGALGCPSYQFCALPPITGLQLLVRKPQGLFHILCIGYDAWQQYVQALRLLRLASDPVGIDLGTYQSRVTLSAVCATVVCCKVTVMKLSNYANCTDSTHFYPKFYQYWIICKMQLIEFKVKNILLLISLSLKPNIYKVVKLYLIVLRHVVCRQSADVYF